MKLFYLNIETTNNKKIAVNNSAKRVELSMNSFPNFEYFFTNFLKELKVSNYYKYSKTDKLLLVEEFLSKRNIDSVYIYNFENIFFWKQNTTLAPFLLSLKDLFIKTNVKVYFNLNLDVLRKEAEKQSLYEFMIGEAYYKNKNQVGLSENMVLKEYASTLKLIITLLDFNLEDENIRISNFEAIKDFLEIQSNAKDSSTLKELEI